MLSELRENQRQSQLSAAFPHELAFERHALPTNVARTPGLLPPALVESCIEFFFGNVYPSQPIIHRQRAQDTIMSMEHSTEAYCMIVALCAYVMIQSNMPVSPNLLQRPEMAQMSNVSIGHVLLEESARVRKGLNYLENPTHLSVLTSWFYYGCYFGLGRDNTAWSYLREATTQAQLLGMHDEESYKNDPLDISRRRVLYWLLFITERYGTSELVCAAAPLRFLFNSHLSQDTCSSQTSPYHALSNHPPAILGRSTLRQASFGRARFAHRSVQAL